MTCEAMHVGPQYVGHLACGLSEEEHIPEHLLWPYVPDGPQQIHRFDVHVAYVPGLVEDPMTHKVGTVSACPSLWCRNRIIPSRQHGHVRVLDAEQLRRALKFNPERQVDDLDQWIVEAHAKGEIYVATTMDPLHSKLVIGPQPAIIVAAIIKEQGARFS